jgi:Family of unknown function (DUF5681)
LRRVGEELSSSASTDTKHPHRWTRGQSGNPRGRPAGSKNKASVLCERLISGEAEVLIRKLIEMAN